VKTTGGAQIAQVKHHTFQLPNGPLAPDVRAAIVRAMTAAVVAEIRRESSLTVKAPAGPDRGESHG
jgi:hypothetical protein